MTFVKIGLKYYISSMEMKLLSVKEYAKEQGITVQAIYKQIKKKQVEFKKIGSILLIRKHS